MSTDYKKGFFDIKKANEQQAERIKQLELENADLRQRVIAMTKERDAAMEETLHANLELAALRQRIADAPVVAWMGEYNINDIRDHYTVVMRHKTDFSSMPDRVRPLYTTPQPAIPDGWQLVPVEPTGEMLQAAFTYLEDIDFIATGVYKAMLAAAPKQEEMK